MSVFFLIHSSAAPSLTVQERAPSCINGEVLYERLDSAILLATLLTSSTGARVTPIMDHCFGVGKTSLVFKFRRILASASDSRIASLTSPGYTRLCRATYLNIRFQCSTKENLALSDEFCQSVVLREIRSALIHAVSAPVPLMPDIQALLIFLRSLPGVFFLFHFDDVGAFELPSSSFGALMLCTMWSIAEQLRDANHFYVFTGRSAFLRLLGKGHILFENRPIAFQSPTDMRLVPLGLLSHSSVQAMFLEHANTHLRFFIQQSGNLQAVHAFTGGVPRAVTTMLQFLTMKRVGDLTAANSWTSRCAPASISSIVFA